MERRRILWVDDEIDLLQPHIIFLNEHDYSVIPVTNGDDAVVMVQKEAFDLVLLDEMMSGRDGLSTLTEIKDADPSLPVVMITKSEEERLMDEAIGKRIDDYLTKPVNPSQILSVCKKILETRRIMQERIARDYVADFSRIRGQLAGPLGWKDWVEIHSLLSQWDVELDNHGDADLEQTHRDQRRECNAEFAKFVERDYPRWLEGDDSPPLSVNFISEFVYPYLVAGRSVFLVVVDCMRLDQWLTIEPLLFDYFSIQRRHYYSILPTATPYSRNALFSGLFPGEIAELYPQLWKWGTTDDQSRNRYERELLERQLAKMGLKLRPKYIKVLDVGEGKNLLKHISSYRAVPLACVVYNFIDILAHSRSESQVLQEIAPDEAGFRSLMKSWFIHSTIFEVLKKVSQQDWVVVLTSDHGSILGTKGTTVYGDRQTSTNIRYKYGDNLGCDQKHAILVKDPREYKLPRWGLNTNFIIAKEDCYFVYPTEFHKYRKQLQDSFQHGGVSLEEMILPVAIMRPK